jgi:hypothetical protein
MYTLGTIRTFRTANFRVIVDAVEEESPDLSWDEDGSTRDGIESGRYLLFCVRARVIHDDLGEIASDYLGNCVYESLEAFQDHRECAAQTRELRAQGSQAVCGSHFSDMVSEVCREARTRLATMRDGLNGLRIRA